MRTDEDYRLTTFWEFEAPLEAVWGAVFDAESWPRWWPGIERVHTLERGGADGVGARRLYLCRSVLPYRLSFVAQVTGVEPLHLLEGRVEGELEGSGRFRLERRGDLVAVRYDWQIRTTRRWMNRLATVAKPLLCWNHDALMRAGGIGLARHLQVRGAPGMGPSAPGCRPPGA